MHSQIIQTLFQHFDCWKKPFFSFVCVCVCVCGHIHGHRTLKVDKNAREREREGGGGRKNTPSTALLSGHTSSSLESSHSILFLWLGEDRVKFAIATTKHFNEIHPSTNDSPFVVVVVVVEDVREGQEGYSSGHLTNIWNSRCGNNDDDDDDWAGLLLNFICSQNS
jgi:hypothetical protein